MSVTSTIDANGRVTFSGIPANSTILKNGVQVATGITGTWTDNWPQRNYKHVSTAATSYTFTGVEFLIRGTLYPNLLDWTITVDGTPYNVKINFGGLRYWDDENGNSVKTNEILWGLGGLSPGSHTVTIAARAGGSNTFSLGNLEGYDYSDISVLFGAPITYTIAGVDYTIAPRPARKSASQIRVDRWLLGYGDGVSFCSGFGNAAASDLCEYIASVAGEYEITGDARLPGIASQMFTRLLAISNGTTGKSISYSGNDLLSSGRVVYSLWYAYKVFGDSKYLTQADKLGGYFLSGWHKTAGGVWYDMASGGQLDVSCNQRTAPALGCGLLFNEPASAYYGNTAMRDIALANATYAVNVNQGGIPASGELVYNVAQPYASRLYGLFEWMHLRYLRDFCGFTATNLDKVETWLNAGSDRPKCYPLHRESMYGQTQPAWPFLYLITDPATSEDYKDLFFAAPFADLNLETDPNNPDYNVYGFAASPAALPAAGLSYHIGYSAQYFKMLQLALPIPVEATVSAISSGGLVLGGSSAVSRGVAVQSAGGLVLSGTATVTTGVGSSPVTVSVVSQGGLVLSGYAVTDYARGSPAPTSLFARIKDRNGNYYPFHTKAA